MANQNEADISKSKKGSPKPYKKKYWSRPHENGRSGLEKKSSAGWFGLEEALYGGEPPTPLSLRLRVLSSFFQIKWKCNASRDYYNGRVNGKGNLAQDFVPPTPPADFWKRATSFGTFAHSFFVVDHVVAPGRTQKNPPPRLSW